MRWRSDLGLAVLSVVVGLFFLADEKPARPVVDVVVGLLAVAAMVVARRRWTIPIAIALIPLMTVSTLSMGPAAVALGVVARRCRWPATLAVVGLHLFLLVGAFTAIARHDPEYPVAIVAVVAIDAAVVASGKLVRSQRLLVESWQVRAREAEEGQRLRVDEARHAERERIAREMHDVLAHRISLLAVHAGALEVRKSAPEDERRAAGVIRESAYAALEDLREVIGMLRSDDADADRPQPTLADVPALVEQSREAGTEVTLERPEFTAAADGAGRHVYRVIQEGLTNARKHAPDVPVRVVLAERNGGLAVEITNPVGAANGAALPGAGSGLIGLRERMELLGGTLEHGRTRSGEFRLCAWVPERAP
ncbi:sensor histidine kinase [Cryptosporangium arvum]|uniref:histidine kinase n=1 Tax=Cryptosporangium arvum DSM 44712 TaxID=927661 RepID=A0A010YZR4_9ACTN|nr:histidine kinase [Cryptosporangium arvum]EXG80693.1 signal transduction histidine kinase [Cryptosporangium arvum DSM 44712]